MSHPFHKGPGSVKSLSPFCFLLLAFCFLLLAFCSTAQTYVTAPLTSTPAAGSYYSNSSILLNPGFSFAAATGQSLQLYMVPPDCIPLVSNLSAAQNYIVTSLPRIGGITTTAGLANRSTCDLMQTVQYLDGLGRPLQTVQVEGSATDKDVVQPYAYDVFGREAVKYLPYAITGSAASDGSYKTDALTTGAGQSAFYTSPPTGVTQIGTPLAATAFELSPLDRPVEQGASGADWQLGHHTVKMVYTLNNATAFSTDSVNGRQAARYYTTISGNTQTLVANGYYPAGTLTVTVSKDENWASGRAGTVEEYKDVDGHVVLKRVYNYTGGTLQQLSTYYVYDDLGRLAFVLPPASGADGAATIPQTTLNNLCYQYQYDERSRMVQKKIPGKGWEYTVYNTLDQPVATQDSLQRANSQWLFTKYDAHGRTIQNGSWGGAVSRASLQSTVNGQTTLWEAPQNSGNGYTADAWPASGVTATLTLNYYDGYNLVPGLPGGYAAPAGASVMTRGLLTAGLTNVLGGSDMLWNVHYYDDLARLTTSYAQHYLGGTLNAGNYDKVTNTYDFTNEVTAATRQHYTAAAGSLPAVTIANTFAYDHEGRKTQTWEQINSGTNVLLSQTNYNEVGQVLNKQLHSENSGTSFLQNVAYAYNERGWLRTSTAPLLSLDFRYNTASAGIQQYNGNIAELHYTAPYSTKVFDYTYDKLNRLTYANSNSGGLDETMAYDVMGNITSLTRGGASAATLAYTYINSGNLTNQLQSVTNSGSAYRSYGYDGNGNATSDGGTKTIAYNLLNLPKALTQSGSTIATYIYDANGQKLRSTSVADSTWDYISGIVYRNGAIAYVTTEEGRAINESGNYAYQYDLKDNLGNNRVVFDKNPTTGAARELQEDEYYAFGLRNNLFGSNNSNRYLYNGKEIQKDLTNQYDYGARFYDPVIARWTTVDTKAQLLEMGSPYNYSLNSPINFYDKDGELPIFINGLTSDDKDRGSSSYWGAQILRTISSSGIPNPGGQVMFVDGNTYAWKGTIYNGDMVGIGGNNPAARKEAGKLKADEDFENILSKLERDPKTGNITEKIQIYAHSRGAAFGIGYTEELLQLINDHSYEFDDPDHEIDFVLNLAANQSEKLSAPAGVDSYSIHHNGDFLSGDATKGVNAAFSSKESVAGIFGSHDITSFKKDIEGFTKSWQKNKGNSGKLIDDFVSRMKSYGIKVTVKDKPDKDKPYGN